MFAGDEFDPTQQPGMQKPVAGRMLDNPWGAITNTTTGAFGTPGAQPAQPAPAAPPATAAPTQAAQPAAAPATAQSVTQQWNTQMPAPAAPAPASVLPAVTPQGPNAAWGELYNQLYGRSKQSLAVDPNDPIIKGQVDAAGVIGNRQMTNDIQAAAERGGAYATGATANYAQSAHEGFAGKQANLQAQLMSREVDSRRKEIAEALSGMHGILSDEEQSRLKQLDQQLQQKGLDLTAQQNAAQNDFNNRSLTQQGELSRASLAQQAASSGAASGSAAAQLAWQRENAGNQAAQRDKEWEALQAQQLWENNYKELFG